MKISEIQAAATAYVDAQKQAGTWVASSNNLAGLLDKIAKTVTIDGVFTDKLPELDGEPLPLGKTVEEWYQELNAVTDYKDFKSDTGAGEAALKPYYPTYQDASYNYTLGRKIIPTTLKYDEYERACNNPSELASITTMILKRLSDTEGQFRFSAKKQILANLCAKARTVGLTHAEFDLVKEMAMPVDTASGEAFLQQVKIDVEDAAFPSNKHSLNGATIGAETGLMLIIKKGIKPVIDVQVEAGAFNPDRLAVPAQIVVVDDFGGDNNVFAMLVDKRIARLHPTYRAIREQLNGVGDYVNYFLHTENTAFIGKNCFVKIYDAAA